jgi:1-aminocyclopropane-1-carboxylate deaminase
VANNFFPKIPLQRIENEITSSHKIHLYVLRLDTIDFYAGGNKYFKLKYNLEEAKKQGFSKLLTFGGAWSNHLAAVASSGWQEAVAGGSKEQPKMIFVIRGEEPKQYSETLRFCKEKGTHLHFVSREEYKRKTESSFIEELKTKFGDFYLLPEGGSNTLAVKGCKEIVDLVNIDFDVICCPVGSGGTFTGIVSGLKQEQTALGFVALKGGDYLEEVITDLAGSPLHHGGQRGSLLHDYHFGGFAKTTPELLRFKKEFEKQFGFELDYIYTAKMFYGIFDLMKKNYFSEGSTIVALHTGGIQGNKGFEKL